MNTRISFCLAVGLALAASACQLQLATGKLAVPSGSEGTIRKANPGVVLAGTLNAPAGLVANNAASLISDQAAGMIGKTKIYRIAGLSEAPLAQAEVYLATADGRPVPGLAAVRTDAQGRFTFPRVPRGFAFVVTARVTLASGAPGQLTTLAKSGDASVRADISLASTLVTAALLKGHAGSLGDFDSAAFNRALKATGEQLTLADVTKLADPVALATRAEEMATADADVQSALTSLKKEIAVPEKSLTELTQEVSQINAAPPAPTQSPSPTSEGASPNAASPAATAPPVVEPPGPVASVSPAASPPATASAAPAATSLQGIVSNLAGNGAGGYAEGKGTTARFQSPSGIVVATDGTVYVADTNNHRIRKVAADGTTTLFAGSGVAGYAQGQGASAQFNAPWGLAFDAQGNMLVADNGNHCIRRVTPDGTVSTYAGSNIPGSADRVGTAARFNDPKGLVYAQGNLYVADYGNHRIRMIASDGQVTTLAGSTAGSVDGTGSAARFNGPAAVALDEAGTVYVTDGNNKTIRRITPGGIVTTLAGAPGQDGLVDGQGVAARFGFMQGLVYGGAGTLYVCDQMNMAIRRLSTDGQVTTLAGNGVSGFVEGTGAAARLKQPKGIALGAQGTLYVAEGASHSVRLIR